MRSRKLGGCCVFSAGNKVIYCHPDPFALCPLLLVEQSNAILAPRVLLPLVEQPLDHARLLGYTGNRGHEPAVAQPALLDVVGLDLA